MAQYIFSCHCVLTKNLLTCKYMPQYKCVFHFLSSIDAELIHWYINATLIDGLGVGGGGWVWGRGWWVVVRVWVCVCVWGGGGGGGEGNCNLWNTSTIGCFLQAYSRGENLTSVHAYVHSRTDLCVCHWWGEGRTYLNYNLYFLSNETQIGVL